MSEIENVTPKKWGNRYTINEVGMQQSDYEVFMIIANNLDETGKCRNLTYQDLADLTPSGFCKTIVVRAVGRLVKLNLISKKSQYSKPSKLKKRKQPITKGKQAPNVYNILKKGRDFLESINQDQIQG